MTRDQAIQKMKDGIEVNRQKHPNGGAFDYIQATGGIALIDQIYDDFEKDRYCTGCIDEPKKGENFPLACGECSRWYADGYTEPL